MVVLVCMALLVWFGIAQTSMNLDSTMQNLNISMALFYAAIPVGCAYLFFDYLLILIYGYHPYASSLMDRAEKPEQKKGG